MRGYGNEMPSPLLLRHPSSLEHDTGTHPERAARIVAIEQALSAHDWLGWDVRESPAVERDVLCAVHPEAYVERIAAMAAAGGGALDVDTLMSEGSYRAALHSAGGAAALVDALLGSPPAAEPGAATPADREAAPRVGASLHRPPGHHALTARAMGFCLFNNVAVAARRALDRWGAERVLVFDWDVHHGNGTNDIFHADPDVLYVSIHESPLYPGTGPASDVGSGAGEGYTVNLPVPAGSGDAAWCSLVEHVVVPLGLEYRPGLVLLSAGYDAHFRDPLAGCEVTRDGYAQMAAGVRSMAEELGVPIGVVLEGGYDLEALAESVLATLEVLGADEPPHPAHVALHPLASAAAARLAERWPLVGTVAG
jgi:acetoin utilization deacetylase AcuC-like enzyme